jgi:hypothetical protein
MRKEFVFKLVLVAAIAFLIFQFGIKPIFSKASFSNTGKYDYSINDTISSDNEYDVIVIGEEPEGIAAAIASARIKAKTLLIAEGKDLGGSIAKCLRSDLEPNLGQSGELLNKGIFTEFYNRTGKDFSVDTYKNAVNSLTKDEKKLDIVYGAEIDKPIFSSNTLIAVEVTINGVKTTYSGKRFIDATEDGKLLSLCNVPYLVGLQDINMVHRFPPAKLNFVISGCDWSKVQGILDIKNTDFRSKIEKYKTTAIDIRLEDFSAINLGDGKLIIRGIEVFNLDMTDDKAVRQTYKDAVEQCVALSTYLKTEFIEFKDSKFEGTAEKFYAKGVKHFVGEYTLTVNDVLENKDFYDKVSIGSFPVTISLNDSDEYVIGKPTQYTIPFGCLVPLKVENLLMVGSDVSYSSLASSSAGVLSTGINAGESAGLIAVYSITKNITPGDIIKQKDINLYDEIQNFMKKQGVSLINDKINNKNSDNWSYSAVRKLNTLGLLAGGFYNNYRFDREAGQQDLAYLILNGLYRLPLNNYTLKLDAGLRPYFINDKLTKEKAAEILTVLNGVTDKSKQTYENACKLGYFDSVIQLRLKDNKVLTMDEVYYLSVRNIELFTGQQIGE